MNNIFNKYNKFVIKFNNLIDKDFKIDYENFNKKFDNNLTRFTTIIASLDFSKQIKIIYFAKNLFSRLQELCIIIQDDLNYIILIERMH